MANRYEGKLGIYLLKVFKDRPNTEDSRFIIRWNTRLNIGDVNFYIMRDQEKGLKELIVSYLTIYQNSHNVIVMDISGTTCKHMIFRHESFHLWE
jgi:3-dehydroquinate synthase class II